MIIKKPYGFLVKHFKIIHLLLLIPMFYLCLKFGDIAQFFRDFVAADFTTMEKDIASTYVTSLTFLMLALVLLVNTTIFFLFKSKKKKATVYIMNIVYYAILVIVLMIDYSSMSAIEQSNNSATTFYRFARDIGNYAYIPSYLLMILTAATGLGFNFKTLTFDRNLDLRITDEDEEEVEIKLGEGYTTKRTIIHLLREVKYYILENKLIITCIAVGLLIIGGAGLYINNEVNNKRYNIYQSFVLDTFTMTLKESYITDVDYSGNKIDDDLYFLAVKISIYNKGKQPVSIDKSNFRVFFDDEVLYPNYDRSNRFIDVGKNYQGNSIFGETADDYVLVYELTSDQIRKQYQMKILSDLKKDELNLIPSYKIINIKPEVLTETKELKKAKVGTTFDLKNTLLNETKINLKSVSISDNYTYTYKSCPTVNKCTSLKGTLIPSDAGNILLIIRDEITWDETTSYYKNSTRDFYQDFATIKYNYTSNGTTRIYRQKLKNVTPVNVEGIKIYELPKSVVYGEDVQMLIQIRNKYITIDI